MGKRGFLGLKAISFLFLIFLLFLFLRSLGFVEVTGFSTHNLAVNEIILSKIIINSNGSVEPVEGWFYKYNIIGCVIDHNLQTTNLSAGFFSPINTPQNPNKIFFNILNDTISETTCEENVCLVYYNVTDYVQGNWQCFIKWDDNLELSNELFMNNSAPKLLRNVDNINIALNGSYPNSIDLDNYFMDLEGDNMEYGAVGQLYITVDISNNGVVRFINTQNFEGTEIIRFRAYDGRIGTFSNSVTVTVGQGTVSSLSACSSVWDCDWGPCVNGQQRCVYFDRNICSNNANKPFDLIQSCTVSTTSTQQGEQLQLTGVLDVQKPKVEGTKRTLLIVGLVVVVLFLIGFGIYLFLRKKPEIQSTQKIQQVVQQPTAQIKVNVNYELVNYIETALQQGQGQQKIRSDLLKAGWQTVDLDYSFNHVLVKIFVKDKLSAGFTKEKIIESLKAKGWKDDLINSIFTDLGK